MTGAPASINFLGLPLLQKVGMPSFYKTVAVCYPRIDKKYDVMRLKLIYCDALVYFYRMRASHDPVTALFGSVTGIW